MSNVRGVRSDVVAKERLKNASITQWTAYTGWGEPQIPRVGDLITLSRKAKSLELESGSVLVEAVDGNVYELWASQFRVFANEFIADPEALEVSVNVIQHPENPKWKLLEAV